MSHIISSAQRAQPSESAVTMKIRPSVERDRLACRNWKKWRGDTSCAEMNQISTVLRSRYVGSPAA